MGRKGKDVSDEVRAVVCTMFTNGKKVTAIAKDLSMPRGTVNTIIQRYKKTGQIKMGKRAGRPPKLTPRDERRLSRLILRNRRTPLMQILDTFNASNDVSISKRHSISIVDAWGFQGVHLSRNKYYTTASPKDQTGMMQTPKILDC